MTCLYNRYWYPVDDMITMPIAMFHVRKITANQQNETSKKRVMLYEPQERAAATDPSDTLREGVMQTVVDNIVKQPKTYTIDALVPFQPVGRYVSDGVKIMEDMMVSFTNLIGGDNEIGKEISDWMAAIFSVTSEAARYTGRIVDVASMFGSSGVDQAGTINKNSLEAMADSGKILCMKMWNGYNYTFVSITGLSFDKDPKEDDVFRATMQLQEMPVLQVTQGPRSDQADMRRGWRAQATAATMGLLAKPLVAITDVDSASGGPAANMLRFNW
jgi:hypothetical protein